MRTFQPRWLIWLSVESGHTRKSNVGQHHIRENQDGGLRPRASSFSIIFDRASPPKLLLYDLGHSALLLLELSIGAVVITAESSSRRNSSASSRNRADQRRASMNLNTGRWGPSRLIRTRAVANAATAKRPRPAAAPIAAVTKIVAAVVIPLTTSPRPVDGGTQCLLL